MLHSLDAVSFLDGPREQILREGTGGLSDLDLLTALLGTGTTGEPVRVVAARLLVVGQDLHTLSRMSAHELAQVRGVGPTKAARIRAALEIGRRAAIPRAARTQFRDSAEVFRYFAPKLAGLRTERFLTVGLDTKNQLVCEREIARGGRAECVVDICEAVRPLVQASAHGALFVHNHPSGQADPSPEDVQLTACLVDALKLLRIRFVDHAIIGDDQWYSFESRAMHTPSHG